MNRHAETNGRVAAGATPSRSAAVTHGAETGTLTGALPAHHHRCPNDRPGDRVAVMAQRLAGLDDGPEARRLLAALDRAIEADDTHRDGRPLAAFGPRSEHTGTTTDRTKTGVPTGERGAF